MANDDEIETASKKVKRTADPGDLSKLALSTSNRATADNVQLVCNTFALKKEEEEDASALKQLSLGSPRQDAEHSGQQLDAFTDEQPDKMAHERDHSPEHPLARLHLSGKRSQAREQRHDESSELAHAQPDPACSPSSSDQAEEQQNKKLRPTGASTWLDPFQQASTQATPLLPVITPALTTSWAAKPSSRSAPASEAGTGSPLAAGVNLAAQASGLPEQAAQQDPAAAPLGSTSAAAAPHQHDSDPASDPSTIDQLLQLIRDHPDSDAAVAAALRAVQRLKRAAPSTHTQPGIATKRAATHTPHDGGAPDAADTAADSARLDAGGGTPVKKKTSSQAAAAQCSTDGLGLSTGEPVALEGAAGEPGRDADVQQNPLDAHTATPVQGKQKKARSKAAGESSTVAVAAPAQSGVKEEDVEEGELGSLPLTVVAGPAAAPAAPVPDMQTYLEAFPACKQLIEHVRTMPNNSTKTPLALVNEYAARLTLEVVWGEEGDTAAGPYTATCSLQSRVSSVQHVQGSGRGRNKRDARQVAAAACMEALLAPSSGLTLSDFLPSLKPATQSVNKRDNSKPGLGFSSSGGGMGPAGGPRWQATGNKKRRDDGGVMGPGGMGGGGLPGAGSGQGPAAPRPVSFTRAVMPSSLGAAHNRNQPEVVYPVSARDGGGRGVGGMGHIGGRTPLGAAARLGYHGHGRPAPHEAPYMDGGWGHVGGGGDMRGAGRGAHPPPHAPPDYTGYAGAYPGAGNGGGGGAGNQGSSSFGMHSLQAILPPAVDAGLVKREKRDFATAMTATGGGAPGGLLGLPGLHRAAGIDATLHAAASTAAAVATAQAMQQQQGWNGQLSNWTGGIADQSHSSGLGGHGTVGYPPQHAPPPLFGPQDPAAQPVYQHPQAAFTNYGTNTQQGQQQQPGYGPLHASLAGHDSAYLHGGGGGAGEGPQGQQQHQHQQHGQQPQHNQQQPPSSLGGLFPGLPSEQALFGGDTGAARQGGAADAGWTPWGWSTTANQLSHDWNGQQ